MTINERKTVTKFIEGLIYQGMRWKPVKALGGSNYPYNDLECNNCGYRVKMVPKEWVYCPHCGKMEDR